VLVFASLAAPAIAAESDIPTTIAVFTDNEAFLPPGRPASLVDWLGDC